jgi:hypothetical protein
MRPFIQAVFSDGLTEAKKSAVSSPRALFLECIRQNAASTPLWADARIRRAARFPNTKNNRAEEFALTDACALGACTIRHRSHSRVSWIAPNHWRTFFIYRALYGN